MDAVFEHLEPAGYMPHALHSAERIWPETNCYVDLWIEVLASQGVIPEAMLGFTLTQDFEGDQFTFFKVPLEDLENLYGIRVTELAIFDRLETHVAEQIRRGRLCLVEMDSFYMPDTRGVAYRLEHGKTTVAINRLDLERKQLDYFHNGGFHSLSGEDFDGLFQLSAAPGALPFLPYTEFAKFPAEPTCEKRQRSVAEALLRQHMSRKPGSNPIRAFAKVLPDQASRLAEREFAYFHKYAFNTLRQLGANFELLASHLNWLDEGRGHYSNASSQAAKIAETAKSVQFQLARALTRKKFDTLGAALDPAIAAWDELMADLSAQLANQREAA